MQRRRSGRHGGAYLSRKDFLKMSGAGLFAGAALLGTAGCGPGGDEGGNTLIFSMGPDDDGTIAELIEKFNKEHEGEFQVRHRKMPADTGQYFDRLRTEFQAGGGDIDVIGTDVIWPKQFAPQDWIQDLSDRLPENEQQQFLRAPIEAGTYDGAIYSVPWFTDAGLLYYRTDLFEQAGISEPPQNWDELMQMAQQVSQRTNTREGYLFQGSTYEGGVCNALEYIWSHGGDVLNDNDEVVIDSPESVAALQAYRSMVAEGAAPQAVATYTETESEQAFSNGNAVFIRTWPSLYGAFGTQGSQLEPQQVDIAPMPHARGQRSFSTLGGWSLSINSNSDMQDEAWEFIQFMTSEENLKERSLKGGYVPPREALLNDRELQKEIPVIRLARDVLIDNAEPRPVTEVYGDMSLEMQRQFNSVLSGDTSPQQAVNTLQQNLSNMMEQVQ